MSVVSDPISVPDREDPSQDSKGGSRLLFDLSKLDLANRRIGRDEIARWNPHRDAMALIDYIPWVSDDYTRAVGLKQVRDDEFWVRGHFPSRPMFPGVLMIESGAQVACFLFNVRRKERVLAVFLRIEDASFRSSVAPGDDLYILTQEVKYGRRRFITDIQGIVEGRIAFEARICGMMQPEPGAE